MQIKISQLYKFIEYFMAYHANSSNFILTDDHCI